MIGFNWRLIGCVSSEMIIDCEFVQEEGGGGGVEVYLCI